MERKLLVPGPSAAWQPRPLLQQPLRPLSLPRRAGRAPSRLLWLWQRAEERAGRSALQGAGPCLTSVPRRWGTASSLRPGSSGCRSTGSSRRQEQAAAWFHSAVVNRRGVRLGPVRWPGRAWRLSGMPPAQVLVVLSPLTELSGDDRAILFSLSLLNAPH